jgi:tetratricopeptide (TPR) repeat protein
MRWWSDVVVRVNDDLGRTFLRLHLFDAASKAFDRVLRTRPTDFGALLFRGWTLSYRRKYAESIPYLLRALEVRRYGWAFYLLGRGLQAEDRQAEAIDAFREAIELQDSDYEIDAVYSDLGVSLAASNQFAEAAEAFGQAASLKPSNADHWEQLGYTLTQLGRWSDAAPCQERVLRMVPSSTAAWRLGYTLAELGRQAEAETVLRQALEGEPKSIEIRLALAGALSELERFEEAMRIASDCCGKNPAASHPRMVLAGVLAESGRLAEAHHEAAKVIDLNPDLADAHATLGSISLREKDGERALAAFDRSLEIHATSDEASDRTALGLWVQLVFGRSAALNLLGRHAEALEGFAGVVAIDPTFFERYDEAAELYRQSQHSQARETSSRATEP